MDISSLNSSNLSSVYPANTNPKEVQDNGKKFDSLEEDSLQNEKTIDRNSLNTSMDKMNQAMEGLYSDIRFTLHEETGRLIVQVVDTTKNEVIKEFPPREFLDTAAKIRKYVGLLLDQKA